MEYRQLQAFHTLMEVRSVSHAARLLGVSQPAVSTLIKRLEAQLGISLFNRDRRRLEPTPEAVLLMDQVTQALESAANVRSAVQDIRHAGAGLLTIAANPTCSISWLPPIVASFCADRPGVRIRMTTRSSDMLREDATTYAADIMIAEPPIVANSSHLERYRLRCVSALPPGHPLCDEDVITPQKLAPYPFIALSRWQATHHHVSQAFYDSRQSPSIAFECELFSSALLLVSRGAGITIAEPISARDFEASGNVVIRPFEPEIRYEVVLYRPHDKKTTVLANEFLSVFNSYMKSLNEYRPR
jgi:DNA-binding transcriptional LysR family regulator